MSSATKPTKPSWVPMTEVEAATAELCEVVFGVGDLASVARKWPNCASLLARRRTQLADARTAGQSHRPSNRGLTTNADLDARLGGAQE